MSRRVAIRIEPFFKIDKNPERFEKLLAAGMQALELPSRRLSQFPKSAPKKVEGRDGVVAAPTYNCAPAMEEPTASIRTLPTRQPSRRSDESTTGAKLQSLRKRVHQLDANCNNTG